jgi:hypothetical protein
MPLFLSSNTTATGINEGVLGGSIDVMHTHERLIWQLNPTVLDQRCADVGLLSTEVGITAQHCEKLLQTTSFRANLPKRSQVVGGDVMVGGGWWVVARNHSTSMPHLTGREGGRSILAGRKDEKNRVRLVQNVP